MEKEKDLEEIYSKLVSEIGKELFTEYLSAESRKRQTNLLLSSIIAILLSFTLVKPTQISIGIITTDSVDSKLFLSLSGLTCLYFITIYILSIIQDSEVYKFRKMPLTIIWHDLKKKIDEANEEYLEEMNKTSAVIFKRMKKRMALEEMLDELSPRRNANDVNAKNGFTPLRITDRKAQEAQKAVTSILKELSETASKDGVDELVHQQKAVLDKGHELFRKELWILNMNKKYDRLNRIKMFIEIGFPISLGIVGIVSTIFALFK